MDATFELSSVPVVDLVYHHKAGGRESPRATNLDYHEGLELLLSRLASVRATVLGIAVDSSVAHELNPVDRELDLAFPIALGSETDAHDLRLRITRAQKPVARRAGVKPQGGNDQKRIRITLTWDDPSLTFERLVRVLTDSTVTGADPDREAIRTLLVDGLTPDQIATRFGGRRGPWLVAIEEEAKLEQEFNRFPATPESVVKLRDERSLRWERIAVRVTGDPRATTIVRRLYDQRKGAGSARRSYTGRGRRFKEMT